MLVEDVLGYLGKVARYDPDSFIPLFIGGERMGCVNAQWRERLLATGAGLFVETRDGLACRAGVSYEQISGRLQAEAEGWRDEGWLNGWRNERFTAMRQNGEPVFELERAAFRPLGLTSQAVHVNGLCRLPGGEVRMWVGRRSPHKAVDPNRMDNMVGGGVASGESIGLALERESWEEAGIPAGRLEGLTRQSLLLAERPVARGLHREWLHVFDVWLPEGDIPCNQDGEVAEHQLLSLEEVECLLIGERFMIDAALVACDCLARLGFWGEESGRILAFLRSEAARGARARAGV
ncbi:NUDIX hydrolase [Paludibacterium paludis]|uniref:Nudix hydrolase domain-containing protein n=1 Tax=Paludibacterium paludis TaxID=1225769 RepID=A0A918P6T1_9NEIS|nr:DUF4743 domain-containing protein [Paludibacterium paludis]GGY27806.1 hypothetical protein GCM10011289_33940 [Paludibacterium paludis]